MAWLGWNKAVQVTCMFSIHLMNLIFRSYKKCGWCTTAGTQIIAWCWRTGLISTSKWPRSLSWIYCCGTQSWCCNAFWPYCLLSHVWCYAVKNSSNANERHANFVNLVFSTQAAVLFTMVWFTHMNCFGVGRTKTGITTVHAEICVQSGKLLKLEFGNICLSFWVLSSNNLWC
jgi:hypothetical protein